MSIGSLSASTTSTKLEFDFLSGNNYLEFWVAISGTQTGYPFVLNWPGHLAVYITSSLNSLMGSVQASYGNTMSGTTFLNPPGYIYDTSWHHVALTHVASTGELVQALDGAVTVVAAATVNPAPFVPGSGVQILTGSFANVLIADLRVVSNAVTLPYASAYSPPSSPVGTAPDGTTALLLRCVSPPPPPAPAWSFVGTFVDYASQARTMPYSANQGGYSATCYPNSGACALPNPTTAAACQAWGAANGLNVIGLQNNGECYGCSSCNYAAQGVASACSAPLGCPNANSVFALPSAPPGVAPPTATPAAATWSFVGAFGDYAGTVRSIPYSANQGSYGASCYPNAASCALSNPTTVAACQAWAAANGLNIVGLQNNGECYGCTNCAYASQGITSAASGCSNPLGCSDMNQVYALGTAARSVAPTPSPPPPAVATQSTGQSVATSAASPPPPVASSPPPPALSPPPPVAQPAPLPSGSWAYQGAFSEQSYGQRTMPSSANMNQWGASCYPNSGSCALPYGASLTDCQGWAASVGFDTIGMQGGYCMGCKSCLFQGQGAANCAPSTNLCNNVNQVYTSFVVPSAPALPGASPSWAVPPVAAAAGYNVNTFSTHTFSASTIDFGNTWLPTRSATTQWWFKQPWWLSSNGQDACSSQPGCVQLNNDGSVTLTNTAINAFRVMPGQQTMGTAFGGGAYIQAVLSFNGAQVDRQGTGAVPDWEKWPAFWANTIECMLYPNQDVYGSGSNTVTRYVETDFFEAYVAYDTANYISTMHDWSNYGSWGAVDAGQAHKQATLYLENGAQFTDKNTYGFLWKPATGSSYGSITPYFNGVAGTVTTWSQYDCANGGADFPNNPNYAPFSILDCQHLALILNTGSNAPMTVYSVDIWQAGTSNNIYYAAGQ